MRNAKYWGSATVGERGQMVIPADARKALEIEPGDKMVIFGHDKGRRLVLVKSEVVTRYVSEALGDLAALEAQLKEEFPGSKQEESTDETSE